MRAVHLARGDELREGHKSTVILGRETFQANDDRPIGPLPLLRLAA